MSNDECVLKPIESRVEYPFPMAGHMYIFLFFCVFLSRKIYDQNNYFRTNIPVGLLQKKCLVANSIVFFVYLFQENI